MRKKSIIRVYNFTTAKFERFCAVSQSVEGEGKTSAYITHWFDNPDFLLNFKKPFTDRPYSWLLGEDFILAKTFFEPCNKVRDSLYLGHFATNPNSLLKGHGKSLIEFCAQLGKEKDLNSMYVFLSQDRINGTNELDRRAFFKKCGFEGSRFGGRLDAPIERLCHPDPQKFKRDLTFGRFCAII